MNKVTKIFIDFPKSTDALIMVVSVAVSYIAPIFFNVRILMRNDLNSRFDVMSTISLTLAGFILTALTIILSYRVIGSTNLKSAGVAIVNSQHYESLVKLYRYTVFTLLLIGFICYVIPVIKFNNSTNLMLYAWIGISTLLICNTLRPILLTFKIILKG